MSTPLGPSPGVPAVPLKLPSRFFLAILGLLATEGSSSDVREPVFSTSSMVRRFLWGCGVSGCGHRQRVMLRCERVKKVTDGRWVKHRQDNENKNGER